jgi:P4 family phage/plasmid primase-like protien
MGMREDGFDLMLWCSLLVNQRNMRTDRMTHLMFSYNDGAYAQDGEEVIQELLVKERGSSYRTSELTTAVQMVQALTFTDLEDPPNHLLCVRNGILNLNTLTLSEHDPAYFFTSKLPVDFRPEAKCPIFMEHLEKILPDPMKQQCLQEIFGYCLLRGMPYHKLFFWCGPGGNGKGVMERTLDNIVGRQNVSAVSIEELPMRFQIAKLHNKLINFSSEPKSKNYLETEVLKRATGQDPIDGEIKGKQKPIQFMNYAKFIVMANKLPKVSDSSNAWWRRVVLLDFSEDFTKLLVPDIELKWLTSEEERSGILNWMVEGLRRLQVQNDFTKSDEMLNAEREYRRYSDPLACFLEDCCKVQTGLVTPKADLYEAYKEYSEQNDFEIVSVNAFNERLRKIPRVKAETKWIDGKSVKAWIGIGLKGPEGKDNLTTLTSLTDLHTRLNILDSNIENNRVSIETGKDGKTGKDSDQGQIGEQGDSECPANTPAWNAGTPKDPGLECLTQLLIKLDAKHPEGIPRYEFWKAALSLVDEKGLPETYVKAALEHWEEEGTIFCPKEGIIKRR